MQIMQMFLFLFCFLLQEIEHFLSVTSCDSLPLTRMEGLKDLKRQIHTHKQQIVRLLKECHGERQRKGLSLSTHRLILCHAF